MSSKSIDGFLLVGSSVVATAAISAAGWSRHQLRHLPQVPVTGRPNASTQNLDVFADQIGNLEGLKNILNKIPYLFLRINFSYLVSVDDDFALLFVRSSYKEHVV